MNHILTLRHLCHCDIAKLTLPLHPYCVNSVKQYSDFDSISVTVLGFMCHNRGRLTFLFFGCTGFITAYQICIRFAIVERTRHMQGSPTYKLAAS